MKKVSKAAEHVAAQLTEAGLQATVYVDGEGEPVFATAWARDLVITKIDLSEPEKKNHEPRKL